MPYPLTRSQTKAAASELPPTPTAMRMPPALADPTARHGMPFRKMYEMRDQVYHASSELSHLSAILIHAQKDPTSTPADLERHEAKIRSKSAELVSLQKKLKPMEENFEKAHAGKKKGAAQSPLEPKPKRKKLDDGPGETREVPSKTTPAVQGFLLNTATLDVALPPGGCCFTADECQYRHLERLRRQYARPFELFCEEMDTINDTCLTGVCLALPDMPWSIALSRLAFLFKSSGSSDQTNYLSAGITIGCEQHVRYIRLAEVMTIQDWRDFMRWAHHQSHVFNLCGRRSCIKLKHMCLEPIDCMMSREKCRADSNAIHDNPRHHDQPTSKATSLSPPTCSSPGCWPPCLFRHGKYSIPHCVAVEFAAFHRVSFGPLTSIVKKEVYTPINEHQLSKLIHNEDVGLIFPFKKSYGRIFVDQWQDNSFVRIDTQLHIPPMYTSEEVGPILERLPTWTEVSFNVILDSLFWYARKRTVPFLVKEIERQVLGSTSFDHRSPRYQCPFCHGFDNFFDSPVQTIADYGDFVQALQHMLSAHTRVPITRKAKFFLEEIRMCPNICHAWKTLLQEKFDISMASLEKGVIPRVIADLCGHGKLVNSVPTAVSNYSTANTLEKRVAMKVEAREEEERAENSNVDEGKAGGC